MRVMLRWLGSLLAICCLSLNSAHATGTVTYTYDALGRLIAAESSGAVNDGQTVTTTFDAAGNRTSYAVDGGVANLAIGNASVTEGETLNFTVTRSGNTGIAVSATYATASGTATSGADFTAASGTVSFEAGETTKTISVVTVDDSAAELAETLTVTLAGPSANATITAASGTGTINDNDAATWGSFNWGTGVWSN